MQFEAEVLGRVRQVTVTRQRGRLLVSLDGRSWEVDAAATGGQTLSLLIREPGHEPPPAGPVSGAGRIRSYAVTLGKDTATGQVHVHLGAVMVPVLLNGRRRSGRKEDGGRAAAGPQRIVAPMPGKIVRLLVRAGDAVKARQPMVVIEAMKMENELRAAGDGVVAELPVVSGQLVEAGTLVAIVAAAPAGAVE